MVGEPLSDAQQQVLKVDAPTAFGLFVKHHEEPFFLCVGLPTLHATHPFSEFSQGERVHERGKGTALTLTADLAENGFPLMAAIQLVCARLYEGQTTNFRTAGGGFAPVYAT